MIIEEYIFDENINNSSDILCLYNDGFLNNLLIKKSYDIMICSILNKNKKLININNQIILNLVNSEFLKERHEIRINMISEYENNH